MPRLPRPRQSPSTFQAEAAPRSSAPHLVGDGLVPIVGGVLVQSATMAVVCPRRAVTSRWSSYSAANASRIAAPAQASVAQVWGRGPRGCRRWYGQPGRNESDLGAAP